MARTIESTLAGLEGSKISTNLNYDPRALALLRTFPRYQKRLETFKGTKWHSKPPCLSPPFCALYGWRTGFKNNIFLIYELTLRLLDLKFQIVQPYL